MSSDQLTPEVQPVATEPQPVPVPVPVEQPITMSFPAVPAEQYGQVAPQQPYGQVMPSQPGWPTAPVKGKVRSPFGVWLLILVTLGIYGLVWHYKVNRELRDFHPSIQVNPALALVAMFFPIASWVTLYNTGKRIAQAQQLSGLGSGCSAAVGVLLCFVFGLHPVYYQSELNRLWNAR